MWIHFISFQIIYLTGLMVSVNGHARLMEPPARNTMWRFGFSAHPNYEDSEMFCGGIKVQWQDNKGKCGVCGDRYDGPRPYETGGSRAPNITVRSYAPGSVLTVLIDVVANHGGKFDFSMCWREEWDEKETEDCFEPLQLDDGSNYAPMNLQHGKGIYLFPIRLPPYRTCSKCVLRWNWRAANNWGVCPDGTKKVGCGPQETYRNCADISIKHDFGIRGPYLTDNNDYKKNFID